MIEYTAEITGMKYSLNEGRHVLVTADVSIDYIHYQIMFPAVMPKSRKFPLTLGQRLKITIETENGK